MIDRTAYLMLQTVSFSLSLAATVLWVMSGHGLMAAVQAAVTAMMFSTLVLGMVRR